MSNISPAHDDVRPFIVPSVEQEDGNEEWDWRGIIDDLTVEIKQLKRKLRQYSRTRPRQLRKDTVFELRTYGLSTDKKRQLEEILRDFAADVEWQSSSAKPDVVTGFNPGTSSNLVRKHVTQSRAVRTISAIESSSLRKSRYDSFTSHVEVTESSDIIQNTIVQRQNEESTTQSNIDKMKLMASILDTTLQHQFSVPKKNLPLPQAEAEAPNPGSQKTRNAKDTSGNVRGMLKNVDRDGSNAAPEENPGGENVWDLDQIVRAAQSVVFEMNRDLAQRSLQSHSKTLEVSSDGHRVRRKATSGQLLINQNSDRDELSSNASFLPDVKVTPPPEEVAEEKSRPKSELEKTLPLGLTKQPHPARCSSVGSSSRPTESPFYKPSIVSGSGESDITMSSNTSSSEQDSDMADISTDTSWSNQSRPHSCDHCKKPIDEAEHPHNGTVTFYRQAPFCVDLSRDGSNTNDVESQNSKSAEVKCMHHHHPPSDKVPAKYSAYSKEEPAKPWNMAEEPDASPFGLDIKPLSSTPHKERSQPIDLEVSGVGEVLPADNFAIHVDVKHAPTESPEPSSSNGEASSSGSSRNAPEKRYDGQILSTEREELDPSSLPPAICAFFSSSDDDVSDSGDESDDFDL